MIVRAVIPGSLLWNIFPRNHSISNSRANEILINGTCECGRGKICRVPPLGEEQQEISVFWGKGKLISLRDVLPY